VGAEFILEKKEFQMQERTTVFSEKKGEKPSDQEPSGEGEKLPS